MSISKLVKTIALLGAGALFASLQTGCEKLSAKPDAAALQERGRYLVENVGMCADCHSPRGERGAFDRTRWLQGTALRFAPTVPMPVWAGYAPSIAGLAHYTDEQAMALLTEGRTLHGAPLRPPMPDFRFNREDARAVLTYLRSLKTGS